MEVNQEEVGWIPLGKIRGSHRHDNVSGQATVCV